MSRPSPTTTGSERTRPSRTRPDRLADDERSWDPPGAGNADDRALRQQAEREARTYCFGQRLSEHLPTVTDRIFRRLLRDADREAAPLEQGEHRTSWRMAAAHAERAQARSGCHAVTEADDTTAQEDARARQEDAEEDQSIHDQSVRLLRSRGSVPFSAITRAVTDEATGQNYADAKRESKVRAILRQHSRGPYPTFVRAESTDDRKGQLWCLA